ncbi:hypothetical protein [Fodinicola feengrottensis]|uniref:Uncharacterized protein n=1 Tax=Fodinicola feengrottensis TaxID=435914 RepID=A0ABP4TPS5_9ACTN|nr:hypothetical protein [Fodinicola feengrottensis]
MAKVIVPVGFDGGPLWDGEPESGTTAPTEFEIATPTSVVSLSLDEYKVWLLSFADPEMANRCQFDRVHLERLADLEFASDGQAVVESLSKQGLLAEFDPEGPSGVEFLKRYRLFPNGDAMGNTGDERHYYRIGREGRVLVKVMWAVYVMWQSSVYYPSLWDALTEYHQTLDEPLLELDQMAQLLAASVPGIVTNRCGFVQAT